MLNHSSSLCYLIITAEQSFLLMRKEWGILLTGGFLVTKSVWLMLTYLCPSNLPIHQHLVYLFTYLLASISLILKIEPLPPVVVVPTSFSFSSLPIISYLAFLIHCEITPTPTNYLLQGHHWLTYPLALASLWLSRPLHIVHSFDVHLKVGLDVSQWVREGIFLTKGCEGMKNKLATSLLVNGVGGRGLLEWRWELTTF